MTEARVERNDTRARIIDVAARLLAEQGPAAVTTRGVAEAAGVQAPAIYRLFGDKDGLLEAVAEHVMATFVTAKAEVARSASAAGVDPVEELRAAWDTQIDFGLANPALVRLLSDPERVRHSAAAREGMRVLEARVHRVALAGRLRVAEQRAVGLVHAAGVGAVQSLLSTSVENRDPDLAHGMLRAVLAQILTDPDPGSPATTGLTSAVTLRALAPDLTVLTEPERRLLAEWLDRLIADSQREPAAATGAFVSDRCD